MTQRNAGRTGKARLRAETLEARDTPAAIGTADLSFGGTGSVSLAGTTFNAVAVQADGKIVAAGTNGSDIVVARYNFDGTLDSTFDADGIKTIDAGSSADSANAIAVQSDGKLVIAGKNSNNAVVIRLWADGMSDTSLGGTGQKAIDFGGTGDTANAIAFQPNGRIVVAGSSGSDFAVARLNPADGTLDTTFNGTGTAVLDIGGAADSANAVVIHPNGSILLAGTNGSDLAFLRVNGDGTLDTTFDADGIRTIDVGGGADTITAMALQRDGKIVAVGTDGADLLALRLIAANGELDNSFHGDGLQTIDASGSDIAKALAIQPDGKIVLAGQDGASHAVAARLRADGSLDTSFGDNGTSEFDFGGASTANGVAIASNGRLVLVGKGGSSGAVARIDGSLGIGTGLTVSGSLNGSVQMFAPSPSGSGFNGTPTNITAFSQFFGNVRTATGDVNGDGYEDTVMVTGPNTIVGLAVVSGADNSTLLVAPMSPFAGSETFMGGGYVSVGDLDNDGRAEIVVTPDQGGGARVSIFSLLTTGLVNRTNFLGITGDDQFRGGARSAIGDINGDGTNDLVVAAGFLGGPRVAVFEGKSLFADQQKLVNDFFAFPGDDAQTLRNGAFVSAGDLNGDGFADLIFGGGPGGAPRVFALSGITVASGDIESAYAAPLANFYVNGNENERGGVRVTAVDADGDSKADIAVGSGSNLPDQVIVYFGKVIGTDGEPPVGQRLDPFDTKVAVKDGVFVG